MWTSRTKNDLIIEVWEKLDCDSVGRTEVEAVETAVEGRFGKAAVPSPMRIARLLADEGAVLRHSEIMELHVERASDRPYDAPLRDIIDLSDLKTAARSIKNLENLRRKYETEGDREGLRLLREKAIAKKKKEAATAKSSAASREIAAEAIQWLTLWLQSPEIFEAWLRMRLASKDFKAKFGDI
jgi:hypothetical protein